MPYRRTLHAFLSLAVLAVAAAGAAENRSPGDRFAIAIESGDLDAVKALVAEGNRADTPIEYGEHKITPLMKAVWDGQEPIARFLIESGADVSARDDAGDTPLTNAITRKREGLARLLLAKGAPVNFTNSYKQTPLSLAVFAGDGDMVELLVKAGADLSGEAFGMTPLMMAASTGNVAMIRRLAALGANVNQAAKTLNRGSTALFSAIYGGSAEAVTALLELKADPNARTKDGDTPLKAARKGDQEEIIRLLGAAGARSEGARSGAPKSKPKAK
jgi:ankyrin repeat protein